MTPPMIATAIGIVVSVPGPTASASGSAPATVATEVMMIGRSRTGQALSSAERASPLLLQPHLIGEVHKQD